jgi:hypothetical protein
MESLVTTIIQWGASQGIGIAMLLFALYWLNNQNKKAAADVKSALDAATTERGARLTLMEQAVQTLTVRVNDCEKDRSGLWAQVVELAKNQGKNIAKIENLQH